MSNAISNYTNPKDLIAGYAVCTVSGSGAGATITILSQRLRNGGSLSFSTMTGGEATLTVPAGLFTSADSWGVMGTAQRFASDNNINFAMARTGTQTATTFPLAFHASASGENPKKFFLTLFGA